MNTLTLTSRGYAYEIDGKPYPDAHHQADFVVDGQPLGERFGFEGARPWFGATCFAYADPIRAELLLQLRGLEPATNQFGTERFVLYRCHCGADYCGVISCRIERSGDRVRWLDVRSEQEEGWEAGLEFDMEIPLLEFDTAEYDEAINTFAANHAHPNPR